MKEPEDGWASNIWPLVGIGCGVILAVLFAKDEFDRRELIQCMKTAPLTTVRRTVGQVLVYPSGYYGITVESSPGTGAFSEKLYMGVTSIHYDVSPGGTQWLEETFACGQLKSVKVHLVPKGLGM